MQAIALALALALAAEEPETLQPETVQQPQKSPASRWAAFSVIVAGAAVAGVGVGFRYSAGEQYDRIDRNYPALADYGELQQVVARGQQHQTLGAGFLIAGAVIMVLGAILSMVLP